MEKEFERIYNQREPKSKNLAERVKDRNAMNLLRDLLFQCKAYHGPKIHFMPEQKTWFRWDLQDIEEIGDSTLTISELKKVKPEVYFRFVGHHLYCAVYDRGGRYNFLTF